VTWTTWWLFATTELVLCLTPGPAVLFVLSSALRSGASRSLASNAGILAANTLYFALSATGLGALLAASWRIFFAIKWIGAAYLMWIGLRAIFGKAPVLNLEKSSDRRLFAGGFLVQVSNPKALVFFTAFLPQFIDFLLPIARQIVVLGATSVVIEFCVLAGYGIAAGRAARLARQPRYATLTNRIAGFLLAAAGTGLATLHRN